MRLAQIHDWPATRINLIAAAPSTASFKLASSNTTNGALPPSSNDTCLSWFEALDISSLPTSVEPVKAILRTFGWRKNSSASGLERLPTTTLKTPPGNPASCRISARASAVKGVAEAGFSTTGHPAASAGAILRVTIVDGKFHGVIAATTPRGCLMTQSRLLVNGEGTISPYTRRASSANQLK